MLATAASAALPVRRRMQRTDAKAISSKDATRAKISIVSAIGLNPAAPGDTSLEFPNVDASPLVAPNALPPRVRGGPGGTLGGGVDGGESHDTVSLQLRTQPKKPLAN